MFLQRILFLAIIPLARWPADPRTPLNRVDQGRIRGSSLQEMSLTHKGIPFNNSN